MSEAIGAPRDLTTGAPPRLRRVSLISLLLVLAIVLLALVLGFQDVEGDDDSWDEALAALALAIGGVVSLWLNPD